MEQEGMFRKLLPYLGEYKKYAILTPLMAILEVACELALPRLMAAIVDVGIVNQDLAYILQTGLGMLILAMFSMTCGMFCAKFALGEFITPYTRLPPPVTATRRIAT